MEAQRTWSDHGNSEKEESRRTNTTTTRFQYLLYGYSNKGNMVFVSRQTNRLMEQKVHKQTHTHMED